MPNQIADEAPPKRSVKELIGLWNERVAQASADAQPKIIHPRSKPRPQPDSLLDLFEKAPVCQHCKQPNLTAALEIARPEATADVAVPNLAQAGKGEARLRLSRIPQPRIWGKKGFSRGG